MTWLDRITIAFIIWWPFVGLAIKHFYGSILGETLETVIFEGVPCFVFMWYVFRDSRPEEKPKEAQR